MVKVIKIVHYIKISPSKSRRFAELCKDMGAQYQSFLFRCISHSLSRGNMAHAHNLREGSVLFLEHFGNEHFVSKLAFLSDTC